MDDILSEVSVEWSTSKLFESTTFAGTISPNGLFAHSNSMASIRRGPTQIGHQIVTLRRMEDPRSELTMSGLGAARHLYDHGSKTTVSEEFVENYLLTGHLPKGSSILCVAETASSYTWSPAGRYLATGSGYPENALRIFDTTGGKAIFTFVRHKTWIYYLHWSTKGNYLVSSSHVPDPRMLIWKCDWEVENGEREISNVSVIHESTEFSPEPRCHYSERDDRWLGFYGYKLAAISPDEKLLAVNASMRNSADYLAIFQLPEFAEIFRRKLRYEDINRTIPSSVVDAESQLTSISWSRDGETIFFCQYGTLYSFALSGIARDGRPRLCQIPGDACVCNPRFDLIAVGQGYYFDRSDLDGDYISNMEFVGGDISIYSLPDLRSVGAFSAPSGIVGMRWSEDGKTLWCVCKDGVAVASKIDPTSINKTH